MLYSGKVRTFYVGSRNIFITVFKADYSVSEYFLEHLEYAGLMNVVKSICNVVQITTLCILVIVVVTEPNSSLIDMPNTHRYIMCFVL